MNNILVIIKKQLKDTLKNRTVLIQFILFPVMTIIMENAIKLDGMPELFFTKLFSVMYIGMAPLTATASIIAEEKEKNTLRVLTMANVKPIEYLMGVGIYVWLICMAGAGVMAAGFDGGKRQFYLMVMGNGFVISILAGACVGIYSRNQMVATSLVSPVMLVFAFTPMLAMFNNNIEKFARFFYTQQLRSILENMSFEGMNPGGAWILAVNAVTMIVLFFAIFKRKGLE